MTDIDLLNSPDPRYWAESFLAIREARIAEDGFDIAADVGTMVGWFSNAFARGEWNSVHYKNWVENYLADLAKE